MKFAPIAKPKQEIAAIGNEEIGVIHLLKMGKITPAENPIDLQEEQIRLDTINATIESAAARLAEKLNCDRVVARNKLFATSIKEADSDAEKVEEPEFRLYDYLSREEINDMIRARENPMATAIKVATLFIKYRVAYPVVLTAALKAKSTELQIEPMLYSLQSGTRIKFEQGVVTTAEFAEDSDLVKVNSDHGAIDDGSVGYVLNGSRFKLGFNDWAEEDTRLNLTEDLIAEIYRFYLIESGQATDADTATDEQEGNENSPSNNLTLSPNASRSTGKKSTGNSNTTDLELATVA